MATVDTLVEELLYNTDLAIFNKVPDLRSYPINETYQHTHGITEIPELYMLLNQRMLNAIYDEYYNKTSGMGFILYTDGILINYGRFKYNNNDISTKVIFPLSYNGNNKYVLHYNKNGTYTTATSIYENVDQTYNIYIYEKTDCGFEVKSNQLYIPDTIEFSYYTFGVLEL